MGGSVGNRLRRWQKKEHDCSSRQQERGFAIHAQFVYQDWCKQDLERVCQQIEADSVVPVVIRLKAIVLIEVAQEQALRRTGNNPECFLFRGIVYGQTGLD